MNNKYYKTINAMSEVAKLMNIDRTAVVRLLDAREGAEADKRFTIVKVNSIEYFWYNVKKL